MWSWAQKDVDHRTELLETFTNAEDASKGQTNQEGEAKQEVCDTWKSAAMVSAITKYLFLLFTWAFHAFVPYFIFEVST